MLTNLQQPWSKEHFTLNCSSYVLAGRKRTRNLLAWFFISVALIFLVMGLAFATRAYIPRDVRDTTVLSFVALFLCSIIGLAVYILCTAKSFRRRFGVHCERCGAEILFLAPWERFADPMPSENFPLHCAKCGSLIAE